MIEYKIVSLVDADKAGLNVYKDRWGEWEFEHAVVRVEDGCMVEIIGEDGGEPEDNTLTRDWAWIDDALNEAYRLGYAAGIEEGRLLY